MDLNMYEDLQLPRKNSNKENKILIFDSLNLFGHECGNLYDKSMLLMDSNWFSNLKQFRNNYSLNLYDPDFVIKEPLNDNSPISQILPKTRSFYSNLKSLKKLRNQLSHANFSGNTEETLLAMETLFETSLELNLEKSTKQFSEAIIRLKKIQLGENFNVGINIDSRTLDFDLQNAELEELLFIEKDKTAALELEFDEIRSENASKQAEILELREKSSFSEEVILNMEYELESNRNLARNLERDLQEQKSISERVQKNSEELSLFVLKLAEALKENNITSIENSEDLNEDDFRVGAIWPYEKGQRKLTLSIAKRDILDFKSGEPIADVDSEDRTRLAETWFKVRPSGGRVFVDAEGQASTLIGDDLIYLGNLFD
jgi:hypothetical protein